MSMTGLGGGGGGGSVAPPTQGGPGLSGMPGVEPRSGDGSGRRSSYGAGGGGFGGAGSIPNDWSKVYWGDEPEPYDDSIYSVYSGGPMQNSRTYNVNELGPENRYVGGAVRRGRNPVTIEGEAGYVQPHSRAIGGMMVPMLESPPRPPLTQDSGPPTQISQDESGVLTGASNFGQPPTENPGGVEGGYNFMTDPGYEFRRSEGMRALEGSAAARGGLLSGGFAKKAMRYGQDYASNEYTNVYNRISNIAGLGQVSANQSGQAALYGGQQMGTAAAQAGYANASGYRGAGNAWNNAGQQIAKLPWDQYFPPGKP